jgi:hypothetical protein
VIEERRAIDIGVGRYLAPEIAAFELAMTKRAWVDLGLDVIATRGRNNLEIDRVHRFSEL